eukprot:443149_1
MYFCMRSVTKHSLLILSRRGFAQLKRNEIVLNHNYLSNGIVSDDHAWFCGWIATDSHINKKYNCIQFVLQLQDYKVLSKINQITNCNKKITFMIRKTGVAHCVLGLTSKQLVNDVLKLFPCDTHQKSKTLPSSVSLFQENQLYVPGYIRGVSDGDGSIAFHLIKGTVSWVLKKASEDFIAGLQQLIYKGCNVKPAIYKETTSYGTEMFILSIQTQSDILELCQWIYHDFDSNLSMLSRKYKRALLLKHVLELGLGKSARSELYRNHQQMEQLKRVQIHDKFMLSMHENSDVFNFQNTFKNRTDLMKAKYKKPIIDTSE